LKSQPSHLPAKANTKKNNFMKVLFLLLSNLVCSFVFAQNVAINSSGAAANASAMLDVSSTNTGVLLPRVALTSTNNTAPITTPATSLVVYNTATSGAGANIVTPGFYYWNGTAWVRFSSALQGWLLNGNAGITSPAIPATYGTTAIAASENWLGTTDANDIVFGTDNIERIRIKQTNGWTGIGTAAPSSKLHIVDNTASIVTRSVSSYLGLSDFIAVSGSSINAPGYGIGGRFQGGFFGVNAIASGTNYTGTSYGVLATATGSGSFGTRIGGYFDAFGGAANYGVIVPSGGGRSGFGTDAPNLAHVQVEGMVGNTVGLFRGPANQGISFVSDWPGIYFNSYFNGGQRNMAGTGYSGIINVDQGNGYMVFGTTLTPNSTTGAGGLNAVPNRMRIAGNGQVAIGQNSAGSIVPIADLTVFNPSTVSGTTDIPLLTARHSGSSGTTWQMGSIEFYTEGEGNIGFTNQLCPLNGDGTASLGTTANSKYFGHRWGTVYTTGGVNTSSDIRLKEKIQPVGYGINQLRKINPITYVMKDQKLGDGSKVPDQYKNTHIGFSAQELKQVIPEVVTSWNWMSNNEQGYIKALDPTLGVNYQEIIPITVNAIKEIDKQQQQIAKTITLTDFGREAITGNELTVTFTNEFKMKLQGNPVVTVTSLDADAQFYISKITSNGFTVKAKANVSNAGFTWMAMAKIKESALAIEPSQIYTDAMHTTKLHAIAAFEATLPTNEEALKIVNAKILATAKANAAKSQNNNSNEQRDKEMIKNAEAAKAEYEKAAKTLQEENGKRK
jgi:hypothetical protein